MAPTQIDEADVIAYVILQPNCHRDSGLLRLFANGVLQTSFYGLAIATYDLTRFNLLFCNADGETENDTLYDSVAQAMETAEQSFGVNRSQ